MTTERLQVRPEVGWRALPGEVLALAPTADQVTSIRGSGAALWSSLLDGASRATLEGDAVRAGCPVEQAPGVVDEVIEALSDAGLIGPAP